jgi:hypothetical protein
VFNGPHGQGTFFGKKVKESGITWPWEFENINPLDPLFATVTWLLNQGKGKIIANPRIVTQAGTNASVTAGFQLPYQSVGALGVPAVQFVNANIALDITPDVDHRGNINTKLQVTVANADPARSITIGNINTPAIATRITKSEVTVKDGEHIIISGLVQEQTSKQFDRTPFLSKIPWVGNLFTSKAYRTDKSELVVIVTPEILTGPERYKQPKAKSQAASKWATSPALAAKPLETARPEPAPAPGTSPFGPRRVAPSPRPADPSSAKTAVHSLIEGMKTNIREGRPAPGLPEYGVGVKIPQATAPAKGGSRPKRRSRGMQRSENVGAKREALAAASSDDASSSDEASDSGASGEQMAEAEEGQESMASQEIVMPEAASAAAPPATHEAQPLVGAPPAPAVTSWPTASTPNAQAPAQPALAQPTTAQPASVRPKSEAIRAIEAVLEKVRARLGRSDAAAQDRL